MKLRKLTAILLCVLLLVSLVPTVTAVSTGGYYNRDYLEGEAAAAYNEQGLGAVYTPQATTWKVWSPTAKHVQLRLYATGSDEEVGAAKLGTYSMEKDAGTGVWSLTLQGDYKNVYYTYLVTARGVTHETRDIYAKAAGVNGYRSMVVDLDDTDPVGWDNDHHVLLNESTDAVIWEIHVRDFSIDPSSGVSEANRGKFLAFTEDDTTLNGVSTCVNYLKEMGVNTVHLLPAYDFGSVDETVTNDPTNRNWGYDPINYNVPEGSYSTDPYDGNTRITEFKEMVQALHEAGISVVMDVVYNHTYDADTYEWGARLLYNNAFNDTVPGYYFRMSGPYTWYNGSGCGNVTASEKLMYRKYMIESVHYWATEYHIDGFRFDLMGCHDVDTMNLIRADLDALDNGAGQKILMYGEPWTGGDAGITNGATQNGAQLFHLNERIGLFCDWMRDAIKGNPDGATTGWVQGNTANNKTEAILGGINANDGRLTAKSQTVTYADAHDNLILWDKLVKSNGGSSYTSYSGSLAETCLKQLRLAETILMVSQGMQFQVGGTEFARNKQGNHNSYNAADSVNAIDWNVRSQNAANADFYKGLIAIRKAFSPFTDPYVEYTKNTLEGADDNCIAYWVPNSTAGEWSKLAVLLNNSSGNKTVTLPAGNWTVLSNGTAANPAGLGTASGTYVVPGFTGVILAQNAGKGTAPIAKPAINGGDTLYADLSSANWLEAGAKVRAYVYGSSGTAWSDLMTLTEGTVYQTTLPSGTWSHVILVRKDPADTGANWDTTWGQTCDIPLPSDGSNFLDAFNYNGNNSDYYHWSTYTTGGNPDPGDDPTTTSYYLVGGMNSWTAEEEYKLVSGANAGEYVLENVALTANTQLKITDGTNWYPGGSGNNYVVPSSGTYNVSFYPAGGQAGYYEGYFKLTLVNASPDPDPETEYYLVGTINAWTTSDAYKLHAGTNSGEYVLEDVAIPAGATLKITDSNNNWYPDGTGNDYLVAVGGTYNVSFYPAGGKPGYHGGYFLLTKIGDDPGPDPGEHNGDDKMILHCWNWSYDTIRQHLDEIKAAGYTAVQTSPAQPPKGYYANATVGDWWMLYQPLGFVISPASASWLGGVDELSALCTAAHSLGIDVIVDVVANHVGNGWDTLYAQAKAQGMSDDDAAAYANQDNPNGPGKLFEITPPAELGIYNPELYPANNTREFFRDYISCTDSTTEGTVRGNIGMPDLRTETTTVQNSVIAYLKALVDAGVDGFRFDAAKHIETPSDGSFASNFWPNVLDTVNSYAEGKGKELWTYGEILYQAAYTRKMSYYTGFMDVTDINYAGGLIYGFGQDQGAAGIAALQFKDWNGPDQESIAPSDVVIFAETHDMYADSRYSTSVFSVEDVNKSWAVAAARADVSALYFARPAGAEHNNPDDPTGWYPVGTMGAVNSYYWKNTEVAEANKFHTAFVGAAESVYASGNYVVVERYDSNHCGAVIVNAIGTNGSLSFAVQHLADGTYYDQITGNEFTVSGGVLSGQMGYTGIVVLIGEAPTVCEHAHTHTVTNAPTCTEDGSIQVVCDDCGQIISSTPNGAALGHIDVNGDNRCDRCDLYLGVVTVYCVDGLDWVNKNDYFTNIKYYAYGEGGQNAAWPGQDAELVGRTNDDHGIWKVELNPESFQYVKFVAFDEDDAELKTVNLAFVDAGQNPVTYVCTEDTEAADFGLEYCCEIESDLESICAHTAYTVVSVNGGEKTICDCCGKVIAEEENPEPIEDENIKIFPSISIGIETVASFSVRSSSLADYASWYIEVSKLDGNGAVVETKRFGEGQEEPVSGSFIYKADFRDITAKELGVPFTASVHAFDAGGQEYYSNNIVSNTPVFTVRDYILGELVNEDNPDAIRTLAADLLNYGAAAQAYFDFDEDHLVNEDLSAAERAAMTRFASNGQAPATLVNSADGPNIFTSVSVMNRIMLTLSIRGVGSPSAVQVQIKEHDSGTVRDVVDAAQFSTIWRAKYSGFEAEDMRTAFDFTVLADGVATGTPITWSVEGYAREARLNEDSSAEELALLNALLHYVDAVMNVDFGN